MNLLQKRCPWAARRLGAAIFFLREYFFPFGCALCGASLITADETWYGLCCACREEIDAAAGRAGERCDLCGKPLISEHGRCLSCRNGGERAFDRVTVLFPYTGKYRKLLKAYKFSKNLALGHYFAEKIEEVVKDLPGEPDWAIVPVPPRPGKIKKAGWDQVEYLARLLEKEMPVLRCLKRLPSKVQKELNREDRMNNLRGRIVVKQKPPETAILLDDVMTTGSTMDVCAAALKESGAKQVYGLCLFYD
ncbi:amidophosphoribosyltransferase [Spirochaetia bacterium]|nr:amidophosphoribosyltransferase [Spirochaetia bacterium]